MKKKFNLAVFSALMIVVLLISGCASETQEENFSTDTSKNIDVTTKGASSEISTTIDSATETTKEKPIESTTKKKVVTNPISIGTASLDMTRSELLRVLERQGMSYKESDLLIEASDGITYFLWTNGNNTYINKILYQTAPNGLKVGDSITQIKKLFGNSEPVDIFGLKVYCYYVDAYQWIISIDKNNKVSGISFSYKSLINRYDSTYRYVNHFKGTVSREEAEDINHQKPVKHTASKGTKESFVQIAESQVGYVGGNISGANVIFPRGVADGFSKYGYNVKFKDAPGHNAGAWCTVFVSWCIERAELPTSVLERSVYADLNWKNFKNIETHIPQRGDLVYFYYKVHNNRMHYANHIGIVTSYNPATKAITTVEGNGRYGQCVRRSYKLDDPTTDIRGFSTF